MIIDLYSAAGFMFLKKNYIDEEKSTYTIADEINTYPNNIRRALQFHKIKIRPKNEAQSIALKTGKAKHPKKKDNDSNG